MRPLIAILQWLIAVPVTILYSSFSIVIGFLFPKKLWVLHTNQFFLRFILRLVGIHVKIEGFKNFDHHQTYVLCSNHQGMFDTVAINGCIPLPMSWLSKPAYFKIPFVSGAMRASRHILVTRKDKQKDSEAIRQAVWQLKKGITMAVFPEGTRTRDGTIGPFKLGAFRMALESGQPILPVVIQGSRDRIRKGEWMVKPGIIQLVICQPILPTSNAEELCEKTRDVILKIYDSLTPG